ncbi:hypothetical protein [Calidifontibacillus erzurumensis]
MAWQISPTRYGLFGERCSLNGEAALSRRYGTFGDRYQIKEQ